jgi:hypothetical protein
MKPPLQYFECKAKYSATVIHTVGSHMLYNYYNVSALRENPNHTDTPIHSTY